MTLVDGVGNPAASSNLHTGRQSARVNRHRDSRRERGRVVIKSACTSGFLNPARAADWYTYGVCSLSSVSDAVRERDQRIAIVRTRL